MKTKQKRAICTICGKRHVVSKLIKINLQNNIHNTMHVCRGNCSQALVLKLNGVLEATLKAIKVLST